MLAAPPTILCAANVVGRMEGEGPLAACFDYVDQDDTFGEATWEQSERAMQQKALALALQKGGLTAQQLDYLFAGDLLNQCVSSSYAAREQKIPFFGLYGACSTFGEGLILASMALDGGFGERAGVVVSSHFCTAERQYRTPLEYGCQRTPTAQWTVTGAGAVILQRGGDGPCITHVTPGKIVDKGVTDTNNMGAAMAPAAYDTLCAHFQDTGRGPDFYDLHRHRRPGGAGGRAAVRAVPPGRGGPLPQLHRLRQAHIRQPAPGCPLRGLRLRLLRRGVHRLSPPGSCGRGGSSTCCSVPPGPSTPPPPPSRGRPSPASATRWPVSARRDG